MYVRIQGEMKYNLEKVRVLKNTTRKQLGALDKFARILKVAI